MEDRDISLVRAALRGITYSELHEIAERTGVPHGTLVRLKYGQTKDPRHSTIARLLDHLVGGRQAASTT